MKKATLWILLLLMFKTLSAQTTVSITVKDAFDYSTPVNGATVTLAGNSVVTAEDGLATFIIPTTAVDTYYSYTVKAPGYIDYQDDWLYIAANSTTDASSVYIKRAFSATFYLVDKNKFPIEGAVIVMSGLTDTTDANGYAKFNKKFASSWNPYDFKITAPGYADYISSLTINNADTVLDTIELKLAFNIKLVIKDGSDAAIAGASVTIGDESFQSELDGSVTFNKKINGDYAYQVSKTGFTDKAGIATVMDKDTLISVTLSTGHDLKLIVINGSTGTIGLSHDTITIGTITKITDDTGIAIFGLDTGNVSFNVKKAGFIDNPVSFHVSGLNDSIVIYMIPDYKVYFTILDEYSYLPIHGVQVNLNGNPGVTDENGFVAFLNLTPSDSLYPYTLTSDSGYNQVSGTLSLPVSSIYVDQFNIINSSLTMNKPGITIGLSNGMMQYFAPATITFNGVDYDYNTGLGTIRIEIAPGTYPYVITPEDPTKAILKGFTEVGTSGNDYQVFDVSDGYKVEIYAADIYSNPISGASVIFAGDTVVTDDSGDAIFLRMPSGDYSYAIQVTGYKAISAENLSVVTSDVMEIATLHLTGYSVSFHITDGSAAVENAFVEFNSISTYSDASGKAVFEGLVAGSFPYTITKDGFILEQGNVDISNADLNKEIVLVVNGIKQIPNAAISIYPNPVADRLTISLGSSEGKNVLITIIDLSGRIVKTSAFANAGPIVEMNVNDLNAGSYLVKVQTGPEINLFKLIKK